MHSLIRPLSPPLLATCFLLAQAAHAQAPPPPASAGAPAQVDPQTEKAREFFHRGVEAYRQGKWADAHALFVAAWSLKKTPGVAANLGECEMKLGRYRDAAERLWYAKENSSGNMRETAERFLQDAQKNIGTIRVTVNVPDADVLLDGTRVGISPLADPVFVDPGSRIFMARVPGRTAGKKLEVAAGSEHTVALVIEPEMTTGPGPDARPLPPPNRPSPLPFLMGGGAVAVVGLGLGIGFTFAANGDSDNAVSIDTRLPGDSTCFQKPIEDDCKALRYAVEARDSSTNVAMASFAVAGVAAVGTGIITYLLWPKAKDENRGSSRRVTPWIGPHGAGLAGTF